MLAYEPSPSDDNGCFRMNRLEVDVSRCFRISGAACYCTTREAATRWQRRIAGEVRCCCLDSPYGLLYVMHAVSERAREAIIHLLCCYLVYSPGFYFCCYLFATFTFQLNSYEVLPAAIFWASRGQRCRPLSPRVLAFISIAHRVQHSHCSSIFIGCCYLALSRFPPIIFYARKSLYQ